MNISPIGINYRNNSQISFQRKPTEKEAPACRQAMKDGLEYLGIQNMALILHGSCFPALGRDTFVGSPYNKASEKVIELLDLHGFNGIQLGPNGSISKENISPYNGSVFAQNRLFIDLEKLTKPQYANILSPEDYEDLTDKVEKTDKNYTYSNFYEAFEIYDIAMNEAFKNFRAKVQVKNPTALKLEKEFEEFKTNTQWLKNDGLFKVLASVYDTADFEKWDNPIDAHLIEELEKGNPEAIERLTKLEERYSQKLEINNFTQFIAQKHKSESAQFREEKDFNYISDLLVGFSQADKWANQKAFLDKWEMGSEWGGAYGSPQLWSVPVLNPDKLFKADGSLGIAGKLLVDKIEASIQDMQNIRVDHALGLVDPYIYDKSTVETYSKKLDDGQIINVVKREALKAGNVSQLGGIDPDKNFTKILSKIMIPTLEKHGIAVTKPVWEDLCSKTDTFKKIYEQELNLPGIVQTLSEKIEKASLDGWALVGSHDHAPISKLIKLDWVKNHSAWDRRYLAGFTTPDPAKAEQRDELCDKMEKDDKLYVETKFVELFRGPKNVQVSFDDLLGISKTYNVGGETAKENWKLRMSPDFEKKYYEDLTDPEKFVLNMPELIKRAVVAKADMAVAKAADNFGRKLSEEEIKNIRKPVRIEMEAEIAQIVENLDKFADILKEKE